MKQIKRITTNDGRSFCVGDWIRFYVDGQLRISEIKYVTEEMSDCYFLHTDHGSIYPNSVLECRERNYEETPMVDPHCSWKETEMDHSRACCEKHGCIANDPRCPVASGKAKQRSLCVRCEGERIVSFIGEIHRVLLEKVSPQTTEKRRERYAIALYRKYVESAIGPEDVVEQDLKSDEGEMI